MLPTVVTKDGASTADSLNQTFHSTLTQRASDIYLESEENHYQIRLRMDGAPRALPEVTTEMGIVTVARLKVLGSLDIAGYRFLQDGQLAAEISEEPISFHIATLPYHYDEKIVLRLFHQIDQPLEIATLRM